MGKKKRSKSSSELEEPGKNFTTNAGQNSGSGSDTFSFTKESRVGAKEETQTDLARVSMYLQASLMERYLWAIEERRKEIVQMYSNETADVWLKREEVGDPVEKCQQLQVKMNDKLEQVLRERHHAERLFKENLDHIESGESIFNLKLVDPNVSFSKMDEFVSEYRSKQLEGSTYSSLCSQDSACHTDDDVGVSLTSSLNLSSYYQWDRVQSPALCSPESKDLYAAADRNGTWLESSNNCVKPKQVAQKNNLEDDDGAIIEAVVCKAPDSGDVIARPELLAFDIDGFVGTPQYDLPGTNNSNDEDDKLQLAYFSTDDDDDDDNNEFEAPVIRPRVRQISLRSEPDRITDDFIELRLNGQPSFLDNLPALNALSRIWSSYDNVAENSPRPESQASVNSKKTDTPRSQEDNEEKKLAVNEKTNRKPKAVSMSSVADQSGKSADGLSFFWKPADENGSVAAKAQKQAKETLTGRSESKSIDPSLKSRSKPTPAASIAPEQPGPIAYSTKASKRKFPVDSTLNKTSICWAFESKGHCPWGHDCIFAHGKKELQLIPPGYKKSDFKTTKQKLDAHPEPCNQQLCAAKLQFLLCKTTICKLWQGRGCSTTKEKCNFAHGQKDLRPLPKYELCERNKQGRCPNKTTECVYAHSEAELRKSPTSYKTLCSSEKSVGVKNPASSTPISAGVSYASAAVGRRRTVSEGSPLSAVVESEELDEECVLCSNALTSSSKYTLNCGHDSFHKKCITRWINTGDPTCPLCRNKEEKIQLEDGWTKVTAKHGRK